MCALIHCLTIIYFIIHMKNYFRGFVFYVLVFLYLMQNALAPVLEQKVWVLNGNICKFYRSGLGCQIRITETGLSRIWSPAPKYALCVIACYRPLRTNILNLNIKCRSTKPFSTYLQIMGWNWSKPDLKLCSCLFSVRRIACHRPLRTNIFNLHIKCGSTKAFSTYLQIMG